MPVFATALLPMAGTRRPMVNSTVASPEGSAATMKQDDDSTSVEGAAA